MLLGFPTHAAYVLDMRMAETPEKVETFLKDLSVKLRPLQEEELALFLKIKQEEVFIVLIVRVNCSECFYIKDNELSWLMFMHFLLEFYSIN